MSNQTTPPDEITIPDPAPATITMSVTLDENKEAQLEVDVAGGSQKVLANTYVTVECGDDIDSAPQFTIVMTASSDFRSLSVESGSSSPWPNNGVVEVSEHLRLDKGEEVSDQTFTVTATDNDNNPHTLDPYIRLRRTNYQVYPGTATPEARRTG